MILQHVGLTKDDAILVRDTLLAAADALEDANGAAPPPTTGSPPVTNEDYTKYVGLMRVVHALTMFHAQVDAYDTAQSTTTSPAIRMEVMAGGY